MSKATFEEFKSNFEKEAYEAYRKEILSITGMEPAIPSAGAPTTWKLATALIKLYELEGNHND